jgi:hypothetical protein
VYQIAEISRSKVWRTKYVALAVNLKRYGCSHFRPLNDKVTVSVCLTSLRAGQRSDESSITNKWQSFSVSPTWLPAHHAPCASRLEWVKEKRSNKQRSLGGRSVFRPLGYQVTMHCIFHARRGVCQRSDELSCKGELKTVSETRSCPTVDITNTWIGFHLLYANTFSLLLYLFIFWAIFPCPRKLLTAYLVQQCHVCAALNYCFVLQLHWLIKTICRTI